MELCSSEKCNSCMACYNACPFDAIDIKLNEYGAIQPIINDGKCKECGLCQMTCQQKEKLDYHYPQKAFALYTKSEVDRKTCASGGAATTFSRFVVSQDGCVFGATSVGGYPHYVKVETEDDIEQLKGSKYVFCDPKLIYKDVKIELQSNRLCLFIGTPCIIGGLLTYLKKSYENLITVDLICHGTPPFSNLKEHIESKIGDYSKVFDFTFRGKNDFYLTIFDKKRKIIYKCDQYEDEYFMSFMQGFMFRPVCYECQFAQNKRISDITIGDFWNLGNDALDGYKGKVSVALLNTDKAISFLDKASNLFIFEERTIEEAINGNDQLRHPSLMTHKREEFLRYHLKGNSFTQTLKKIGIVSRTRNNKVRRYILFVPRLIKKIFKN